MESYFLPWETEHIPQVGGVPESVSGLTGRIKSVLERQFLNIYVEGEVTDFRGAWGKTGHVYFTLKDKDASIQCVIWSAQAARMNLAMLANGAKLEIRGKLTIYAPRGNYQIQVMSLQVAGVGVLWQKFEEMKARLSAEGLFDEKRKRPLPLYPQTVGVVTARTGAVIRDIITVLGRRAPAIRIVLYDVKVQGDGAAAEIAHAIERMNELPDIDVLIVGRGGGSMQDLWAFNEEPVARAIVASRVPVISAVGHETDFSISDFVADVRAATPSMAAEIVAKSSSEILERMQNLRMRLQKSYETKRDRLLGYEDLYKRLARVVPQQIERQQYQLKYLRQSHSFERPYERIQIARQQLDEVMVKLQRNVETKIVVAKHRLEMSSAKALALNPHAVLARGYSIVYRHDDRVVVRHCDDVAGGTALDIQLHTGRISAVVGAIEPLPIVVELPPKKAAPTKLRKPKPKPAVAQDDLFGEL